MDLKLYSDNIENYLEETTIIDFSHFKIKELAAQLKKEYHDEVSLIKATFEYVRDYIGHSIDIKGSKVTLKASEVLIHEEGFCYAKSHLLAALLRCNGIPTGFCYQRLILNNETASYLVLHGLNGVYVKSIDKWIRLDARGNKHGVDAQFNLDKEQLAFPINRDLGEEDIMIIFTTPDKNVIDRLSGHHKVSELLEDLPRDLLSS